MGLLEKVKNLFTEEVEEEPVKSEVISVEIPSPVKKEERVTLKEEELDVKPEIKRETKTINDEVVRREDKPKEPIFFDDSYFKELEKPKEPKKEIKREVKSSYMKEKKETKKFTPTPIISPVYGVLDKNYNKEDITTKKERERISHTNTAITIDEVRKKAYGTLEDDIETTLFGSNSILFNEPKDNNKDLFDDLVDKDIDIKDDGINIVEEELDDKNMVEDILDDKSSLNSELFDLIDSMYEKGDK